MEDIKKTEVWQLYEKNKNFNYQKGLYTNSTRNYNFYYGNQWEGAKLGDMEPVSYNIIEPIVRYKVGILTSNLWGIHYSAENYDDREFQKVAEEVCDNLSKHVARIFEKENMDYKLEQVAEDGTIDSEGIIYVWYKDGEVTNKILSKADVLYGNENDEDIQSQPYILIKTRKPVEQIREMARQEGLSEKQVSMIMSDELVNEEIGDDAKEEINDSCTMITKLYKEDGNVFFSMSTMSVDIVKDQNTGLTLYPLEHFVYKSKKGSARGLGEVESLIPNQIEINRMLMRRLITIKYFAYPKAVVNRDYVDNPKDALKFGGTIYVKGKDARSVTDSFDYIRPAQLSPDAERLQTEFIETTRELKNASTIATGDIDPEKASGRAILAVQEASKQPMTQQVSRFKRFIEGLARIYLDFWKAYSAEGKEILVEEEVLTETGEVEIIQIPYTIPATVLERLEASVKVDITPRSPFDKFALEMTLENMFKEGYLSMEEFVKALPQDSVMPKRILEEIIEDRQEAQQEIALRKMEAERLHSQYQNILSLQEGVTELEAMQ